MDGLRLWDRVSASYDRQSMSRYAQTYADTIACTRKYLQPTQTVLDYACGTGITTVELAPAVRLVHAVDFSERMIDIARQKAAERAIQNIDFAVTTLADPKLQPGIYDVVMAFNLLGYLPNSENALRRIHELLPPGGLFISATDCWGELPSPLRWLLALAGKWGLLPYTRLFTTHSLEQSIAAAGFQIVEARNLHAGVPNYFIVARKV